MQKILTRDGSYTIHNEQYDETYHCKFIGALEEARVKYAEPLNLKDNDHLLDFCFGIGYNTIAALKINNNIKVTALELDIEILKEILTNEVPEEYKEQNQRVRQAVTSTLNQEKDEKINIIIGKAEEEIKLLPNNYFNGVLFDPFSPGKHKEMWSLDIFKECFRVMKPGSRLTTYSCAVWIRDNMREAGFQVIDGPILGRKSASTIAIKPE